MTWADSPPPSNALLGARDPWPVVVTNLSGSSPFVLIGDHAGRAVPERLAGLGLTPSQMDLHIAWDIGVSAVGRALAQALNAPFIEQVYSRLVIDCNRRPGAAGSIAAISDGIVVPGNIGLGADAVAERQAAVYQPYHDAIAQLLDHRNAVGRPTWLVSLHSFTPIMDGLARPWRMGVLHRGDSALSDRVLALLREALGEAAGDNAPYQMDETDNTVPLHCDPRGLDYLELEIRQDLIGDAGGQAWAADLVTRLLPRAI